MRKEYLFIGVLFFITLGLVSCATQGDLDRIEQHLVYLNKRIERVENKQQKLENNISSQQVDLLTQLGPLEDKIKQLRGQREETLYELHQLSRQIKKSNEKISALAGQLAALETRLAHLEKTIKHIEERPVPYAKDEKGKVLYQKGLNLFRQRDYTKAIETFNLFLKRYPFSRLAGNAQFWLGESYFVQKKYEEAILAYQRVIKNYPKSIKVPDALFKQGKAFALLGDDQTARILWKQVIKKYPKTRAAVLAQKALKRIKK